MAKKYTVSSEVKLNIVFKFKIYLVLTFIYQNIVLHTGNVNLKPFTNYYYFFFMAKKYTVSIEVKLNIVFKFKIYLVSTFIYQNIVLHTGKVNLKAYTNYYYYFFYGQNIHCKQ